MKLVEEADFDTLMDMMEEMRAESPVLKEVKVDRERTYYTMKAMLDAGQLIGVVSPHGCMLGIVSANWYSEQVNAYEQMLYVRPEKRKSPHAYRLVKAFEEECIVRGAKTLHVGSSTGIDDERTARFYSGLGYRHAGQSLRKELDV